MPELLAIGLVVFLGLMLLARGLVAVDPHALAVFMRRLSSGAVAGEGPSSRVETRFLAMTLDHASGAMSGRVLDGPWRGRALDQLKVVELVELLDICVDQDPPSATLLEAWVERALPDWRRRFEDARQSGAGAGAGAGAGQGMGSGGALTREEALAILGLAEGADADAIKEAHRRLMKALHPDQGGSTYLAAKINQAKDRLSGT